MSIMFIGAELVKTNPDGNEYRVYFDGRVNQKVLRSTLDKSGDTVRQLRYVAKTHDEGSYQVELVSKKNFEQLKKKYRKM